MQYFPAFPQNPVVPSYYSYLSIDFVNGNTMTMVFPSSFTPIPQADALTMFPLSSLMQYTNSGAYTSQTIVMPDATLGATGIGTIFYNATANPIDVKTSSGATTIVTINAGQEWCIFLTDNTTSDGNWITFQAGAGTSAANANELAGNGLYAIGSKLNVITNVVDTTSLPTTFTNTDGFQMYNVTSVSEPSNTWIIPAAPFPGFTFYIKNSSNTVLTLKAQGISLIDNQSTVSLGFNDGAYILSQDTNWLTIGLNQAFEGAVEISPSGIKVLDGSAAIPSYSFINYPATGLFTEGSNDVSFTSDGTQIASVTGTGINVVEGDFQLTGVPVLYLAGIYP